MAVRNPSFVRMYVSASMSRSLVNSSRQSPVPAPTPSGRPLSRIAPLQVVGVEVHGGAGSHGQEHGSAAGAGIVDGFHAHFSRLVAMIDHAGETLAHRVRGRWEQRHRQWAGYPHQEGVHSPCVAPVGGGHGDRCNTRRNRADRQMPDG